MADKLVQHAGALCSSTFPWRIPRCWRPWARWVLSRDKRPRRASPCEHYPKTADKHQCHLLTASNHPGAGTESSKVAPPALFRAVKPTTSSRRLTCSPCPLLLAHPKRASTLMLRVRFSRTRSRCDITLPEKPAEIIKPHHQKIVWYPTVATKSERSPLFLFIGSKKFTLKILFPIGFHLSPRPTS
jgi:hypothetical protein